MLIGSFKINIRPKFHKTFMLTERLCLSSRPTEWFAATMSVSLATCAAIVFIDTMIAIPSLIREHIWGDLPTRRAWMRHGSYNMLVDLLRANTKGLNPLNLPVLQPVEASTETRPLPSRQGTVDSLHTLLPPIDQGSLTGGRRLKGWLDRNQASMRSAMEMLRMDLYAMDEIRPIGNLCKVYSW